MDPVPAVDRAPGLSTEVATWPPIRRAKIDGRQVGLSGGFTRRGNSVVAVDAPQDPVAAPTSVMVGATHRAGERAAPLTVTITESPDRCWFEAWRGVKASADVDLDLAERIVRGSPAPYLTARDSDPTAAGGDPTAERANATAIALYEHLGFRVADAYHYRQR